MSKLNLLVCACMLALAALTGPAFAQYMYLDTDGDGANSPADTLGIAGPTTLTVYLNSNHDRDGTLRSCNAHTGAPTAGAALAFFTYTVVLKASGGTVAWGTFTPDDPAYTPLGTDLADTLDTEFTRIRPAGSVTPAGLVKLGTISVSVVSGSPRVDIGTSTQVDPFGFGTGFGTSCDGSEYPNSYVLGTDWFDSDGIGSGPGVPLTTGTEVTSSGSVYFGGNRLNPPYELRYINSSLVVNGYRLADTPTSTPSVVSATLDSIPYNLSSAVGDTIRLAYRRGDTDAEILGSIGTLYRASGLVDSFETHPEARSVSVYYHYLHGTRTSVYLPSRDSPALLPIPQRNARLLAQRQSDLLAIRQVLEKEGLLIVFNDLRIMVPSKLRREIDASLLALQSGKSLSEESKSGLKVAIPERLWTRFIQPSTLVPAR